MDNAANSADRSEPRAAPRPHRKTSEAKRPMSLLQNLAVVVRWPRRYLAALARRRPDQAKPTSSSSLGPTARAPSSPRPAIRKKESTTAATSTSPSAAQPARAGRANPSTSPRYSCKTRESLRSRHFHNAAPAELSGAASPDQLLLATARPSGAFPNRRLNAETSANVRKQYLTVFSGRSTYMSHSKLHPSSQSRMSMAAAANDSATW